jgi:hypothetical protein
VISGFVLFAGAALISTAIAGSGGSTQDRGPSATAKRTALAAKKKRKRGKRGPQGPAGAAGLQGAPGVQGVPGVPGTPGNGTAVWIHQVTQTPADCTTPGCSFVAMSGTIATAGQYLVTAKIRLNNPNSTFSSNSYTCRLERTSPTTTIDTTSTQTVAYLDGEAIPLQGATTFAAGDSVQISCTNPPGAAGETVANQGSIIATPFAYTEQSLP